MHDLGRRVKMAVIAVSAAALIGGCAGADDEPATLPDTAPSATESVDASPTPEATTSPSPTPTADPTATLEAEVEAFFNEYAQLIEQGWASSGALAEKSDMYSETCSSCVYISQQAERAQREGLEYVGGETTVDDVQVVSSGASDASVMVATSSESAVLRNAAGESVETFHGTDGLQTVYQLRRVDGAWVIISDQVL